jgi:hypothetical protein
MSLNPILGLGVMWGLTNAYGETGKSGSANNAKPQSEPEVFKLDRNALYCMLMNALNMKPGGKEPEVFLMGHLESEELKDISYTGQLLTRLTWSMVTKAVVKLHYHKDITDIQAGRLSRLLRGANKCGAPALVLGKESPLFPGEGLLAWWKNGGFNQLGVLDLYVSSKGKFGAFPDSLNIQLPAGFKEALNTLLAPKPAPVYRPVRLPRPKLPKREALPASRPAALPKAAETRKCARINFMNGNCLKWEE